MKVYKINDRGHFNAHIIYLDSELTPLQHKELKLIQHLDFTDIIFIFSKDLLKKVSPSKFSQLYGATYYSVGKSNDEFSEIWGMIDYLDELDHYTSFTVCLQIDLISERADKIKNIVFSNIDKSVFKSRDLDWQEMKDIYTIKRRCINILKYKFYIQEKQSNSGMYSSKISTDDVMFLRLSSISSMKEKLSKYPESYFNSFIGGGIKKFIASVIDPKTYLNYRVDETKISGTKGIQS